MMSSVQHTHMAEKSVSSAESLPQKRRKNSEQTQQFFHVLKAARRPAINLLTARSTAEMAVFTESLSRKCMSSS